MNLGKLVFAQVTQHLPLTTFRRCVARYAGERKVKSFSCLDQYLCMAFAQLTYRESLRDIEACLRAQETKLYHMGIQGRVSRSTLADQAGDVGQQSGSDQDDSRDQDEKTIEKLFGRHRSLLKFPLDAVKNPQSLKSSQVCAYDAGPEDQQQGRQGPQTTADFDQKDELHKGNHDEHRQ